MYMFQSCEPLRAVSVKDEPFCFFMQEITKALEDSVSGLY